MLQVCHFALVSRIFFALSSASPTPHYHEIRKRNAHLKDLQNAPTTNGIVVAQILGYVQISINESTALELS